MPSEGEEMVLSECMRSLAMENAGNSGRSKVPY